MLRRNSLSFALSLIFTSSLAAQTGTYAFGSYDSKGFDSVNLGNLNTHFSIPIVSKAGRGLPFTYALNYDGLVWSSSTSQGTGYWQPDPNWGFYGQLGQEGFQGYISYRDYQQKCFIDPPSWFWAEHQTNYVYHDQFGVEHWINYSYDACTDGDPESGDGSTSDGSGISWDGSRIRLRSGALVNAPINTTSGSGSITDTNGNTITNNGNGTFVDTTGTTELTISGGGNANSPLTFTYPVALQSDSATSATVTVYYKTYTVETNFGCSGITEYGATSVDLVDHVTLADSPSDTYTFTYESTPGISGAVTGRLAVVTLPSGGTISYSYSGGCSGGINTDGTPATLLRTTSDGTKTYARDISQSPVTTTVVSDEQANETDLNFITDYVGHVYETSRSAYQGPATGSNQLESRTTAYNGQGATTQLSSQITETDVTDKFNGIKPVETITNYDYGGMATSSSVQDPSNGNQGLLAASASYNSYEEITSAQTTDPVNANATVTSATYGYDEGTPTATSGIPQHNVVYGPRGNQTSAHVSTGSATLNSSTSYYDTGETVSSIDPGGFTTNYGYDATQTFVAQTTLPTPSSGVQVSTSAAFDTTSGVQTSATGANAGQIITYAQYDRLLRPTQITTPAPDSGVIRYAYSPTQTSVTTKMNSTQLADQETFLDSYGRTKRVAVANGSGWYFTDSCYDAAGRLQYQSIPYYSATQNPSGNNCAASTAVQYSYDALGRQTQVNRPDGSSTTFTYNGRATKSVSSPGTTHITQYDLLGRISSVCEVTSTALTGSGSPVDCASDIAGTGYLTTYAYNLSAHTTTVNQGGQTRTFQTDAIGRTTSTTEPEAGTTNFAYAYNSTGLLVTRTRPRANQPNPSTLTTTQTQYDSLGRVLSIGYDDGTPTKTFSYDTGVISGDTNYAAGQLTVASTSSGSGPISQHDYGYDIMGRVNQTVDCVPGTCGSYDATRWYGYNSASQLTSETYASAVNGGSPVSLYYGYNLAGQLTAVTGGQNNASQAPNIFTVSATGPSGPTLAQYGNGVYSAYQYDAMVRVASDSICSGSSQPNCPGGTMLYGYSTNWSGKYLTSMCDFVVYQCANLGYDDLGRLGSLYATSGNANSFSYSYDRWGNRLTQTATQGSGPQPTFSFNTANNQIVGYTYDAAGNVIGDGIHSYSYDAENNLLTIDGGSTASYAYDALNERVQASTAAGTELYDFDLNRRRATTWTLSSPNITAAQYYAGSNRVAYWTAADGNIHFEHQDWLGTERARTGTTGSVEGSYVSLPFGDGVQVSGSDSNPGHFAMLDRDVSSSAGLSHAMFREYSSTAGRWMNPDPDLGSYDFIHPQSLNRYIYALDNPLSSTDPSGRECVWDDGSFDAADDPNTGNIEGCESQGGTYVDPAAFATLNAGDWSSQPNQDIADVAQALNSSSTVLNVSSNGDPSTVDVIYTYSFAGTYLQGTQHLQYLVDPVQQLVQGVAQDTAGFPDVCSGGAFVYAGVQSKVGSGHGFAGYLGNYDSKDGWSNGGLVEGSKGNVSAGAAAGPKGAEGLFFIPLTEAGGGLVGISSNGLSVGGYAGTPESVPVGAGGGAYFTISTMGGCAHR